MKPEVMEAIGWGIIMVITAVPLILGVIKMRRIGK